MTNNDMVRKFQEIFGANIGTEVNLPNKEERTLRIKLLKEEFDEYLEGEDNNDIIEIADALGDMMYIIYGTAISYGIPLDDVFKEIHDSNMSKLDKEGKPIRREDGKILKGEDYFKPDIKRILNM